MTYMVLGPLTEQLARTAAQLVRGHRADTGDTRSAAIIAATSGRVFVVSDDQYALLKMEFNVFAGPVTINTDPDLLPPLRMFGFPIEREDGPTVVTRPDLCWRLS